MGQETLSCRTEPWHPALHHDREPQGIVGGSPGRQRCPEKIRNTLRVQEETAAWYLAMKLSTATQWLMLGTADLSAELSKGDARHTREGGEGAAPIRHLQGGLVGLLGSHSITPRAEISAQPCRQSRGVPSHTCKTGARRAAVIFGDENTHLFIFMYIQHLHLQQTEHLSGLITSTDIRTEVSTSLGQIQHLSARCVLLSPAPPPRAGTPSPPALPTAPARAGRGAGAGPPDSSVCRSLWQTGKIKKKRNKTNVYSFTFRKPRLSVKFFPAY